MTPAVLQDIQTQLRDHGKDIVRLDEHGKAQDAKISDISGTLTWILRGVIVLLIGLAANLLGLHR